MKKFLSMVVTCAMTLSCLTTFAFASEATTVQENAPRLLAEQTTNEYDMYVEMKDSINGLNLHGQTIEEILLERASLPAESLADEYGYSAEQISLLKEYDGSPIEDNPQLRGVFANMDGRLLLQNQDDDSVCVKFEWEWDGRPMLTGYAVTDVVTCAWIGVDSNNKAHALRLVEDESKCKVYYYSREDFSYKYSDTVEIDDTNPDKRADARIQVGSKDVNYLDSFVMAGEMEITLEEPVTVNDLQYCTLVFGYGHTVLTFDASFSVDVSGISLSIAPTLGTEAMFNGSISIWSDGSIDYGGDAA